MLRAKGPAPLRIGRRVLYDIKALDRWADRLDGQPLSAADEAAEGAEATRRWLEKRGAKAADAEKTVEVERRFLERLSRS